MYLTLESNYAVKIVDCLARNYPRRMGASAISSETAVTLRFSLKILNKLTSSGVVNSFKGAAGGYELSRPPEEITLRDVIETIEGPFSFSRCLEDGHTCKSPDCSKKGACRFQKVYEEISSDVRRILEEATFKID